MHGLLRFRKHKNAKGGWAWRLTPVLPVTQEAGIRIMVQGQHKQKVSDAPSQQRSQVY
jgi:hypothetical protein